jgi:CTP:molybdopterin cytidylyltransferase MocA
MSDAATGPGEARVAGLLLAAGDGSRMGGPKALVTFDGRLLVEQATEVLRNGGCDPVVVVLGAGADEVRHHARLADAGIIDNPNWGQGQAGSLRIGLVAMADREVGPGAAGAVLVGLVDQPGVTPAVVRRLIVAWQTGAGPAVVATYAGRPRNPVLFDRSIWAEVEAAVEGDEGARGWLREARESNPDAVAFVECGEIGDPTDLDTPADLHAAAHSLAASGRSRRS